MQNKLLAAIGGGVLLLIGLWLILRKKESTESVEKNSATTSSELLNSLQGTVTPTANTTEMTPEEKIAYEERVALENQLREQLNALKIEYSNMFGKVAPAGSTIEFLTNAINQQKAFLDLESKYKLLTGDTDTSDNNFVTLSDIESAMLSYNIQKEQAAQAEANRLNTLAANWSARQSQIGSLVGRFLSDFKNDGSALRTTAWSTAIAGELSALSDVELVYAEKFFNSLGVRYKTVYGGSASNIYSIQQALNTKVSFSRKNTSSYTGLRGRLASINSRYPVGGDNINQYGNLKY